MTLQATIEALRSQLEVAHHQPLCATADSACAGTRFLDRDRATCMRALDKATGALEASLPTLSEGVLQLASNSNTKPCTAGLLGDVGNSSATAGRTPGQAQSQAVLAGNKLPDVNVENIIKELQQLHDVIHASCMFNHQVCTSAIQHTQLYNLRLPACASGACEQGDGMTLATILVLVNDPKVLL